MCIFNNSVNYTMKALTFLADRKDHSMVLSSEIAKMEKIPYHYLAKILQGLTKFGYVESAKGRNGGFHITKKGLNCTIALLIKQTDGFTIKNECILTKAGCSEKNPCALHKYFSQIGIDINRSILELRTKDLTNKKL